VSNVGTTSLPRVVSSATPRRTAHRRRR
jgi:hypothetical protein